MSARITIHVDDDIPAMLVEMAEGSRKQGDFLSRLIRAARSNQHVGQGATIDSLRLQMVGLIAELHELRSRIAAVEGKLPKIKV